MHAKIHTVAFQDIETSAVMVQIHIAFGLMVAMGVLPRRTSRSLGLLGDAVACIGRVFAFNRIPRQRCNIYA
jgi:hypothetical protein